MAEQTVTYAPPHLTPLPFIAFDKHQTRSFLPAVELDEELDAAALLAEHGSPLYVVSESRLRQDYREFCDAFEEAGIETRIAYSVKTNYLPAVCATLRDEGAWAEVVSGMEYELCRSLGIPGQEIIFNGPHKTPAELSRAVAEGALVNVDNFDELALIEQLAGAARRPVRIGIRVSFRHGHAPWVKFGFSDDNGDAGRALERIAGNHYLDLQMLHHHGGTFVLDHQLYATAAERLIALARQARALGLRPSMLDFGGGFPSRNTLKPQFDVAGGSVRSGNFWAPYAEAIMSRVQQARELLGGRPTVILEPGRALVDASTCLLCTVTAIKSIDSEDRSVIVDAGVNLVPTVCYYDHDVALPDSASGERDPALRPVSVYGPLCMQSDKLRDKVSLPGLSIGDPLVIFNVGAYCHSQSMQFIQTRPATVLLGAHGAELIRRRETWRDVFALDRLPDRLASDDGHF